MSMTPSRRPTATSVLPRQAQALIGVYLLALAFGSSLSGQTVEPLPTATPAATPLVNGSPTVTITSGVPSAAAIEAYNAARTPQVTVTIGVPATLPSRASRSIATSLPTASTIKPAIVNGVCTLIALRPASGAKSQAARATTNNADSSGQPAVTVVLTYGSNSAGQPVWVQMLRGGTLSATDDSGTTYDGSRGFFLTLDANGSAAFSYQAPDVSGTYQVLTRFSNAMTVLPFVVP